MLFARYGFWKLSISLKPSTLAHPLAISEYPLKSQYIWKQNITEAKTRYSPL